MMEHTDIQALDFQRDVLDKSQEVPVVVDFWAAWCGPCKILGPVIEKMASEAKDRWVLVKINTEHHQDLAMQYRIQSIPAVKMFYHGKVVGEFMGALPEFQIQRWLDKHLPDPRLHQLEALFQKWNESKDETTLSRLEAYVAENPDLWKGSLRLASIKLATDPAKARELVAPIHQGHELYSESQDIIALADLTDVDAEGHPKVLEMMAKAKSAWQAQDVDQTLDALIQAIMLDKTYSDELARRAVVAIFHQLTEQHPLTKKYRPRFGMALY
ncbi:MAG: thioredoxin [Bacteroidota bacterium]